MSPVEEDTTTDEADVAEQKEKEKKNIQKLSTKGIVTKVKSVSSYG